METKQKLYKYLINYRDKNGKKSLCEACYRLFRMVGCNGAQAWMDIKLYNEIKQLSQQEIMHIIGKAINESGY